MLSARRLRWTARIAPKVDSATASSQRGLALLVSIVSGPSVGWVITMEAIDLAPLLRWGHISGRNMPWRDSRDEYELTVAEILLQKTRAHAAVWAWRSLLSSYPRAADLADADADAIAALVGHLGLGTQRVDRLQAAAKGLVAGTPRTPGLGPYGRGVVALTIGRPLTSEPVDGNIARVLTRFYGWTFLRGEPRKKAEVRAALRSCLDAETRARMKLKVLYGLVDLGALVCTPSRPKCDTCPLRERCASSAGNP